MLTKTTLPNDIPQNLIVSPSMNRWVRTDDKAQTDAQKTGSLPKMLSSVVSQLERDGDLDSTFLLVSDASNETKQHDARDQYVSQVLKGKKADIFMLTPETQAQVVDLLKDMTGLDKNILDAIVTCTGYAGQRIKLDVVAAAHTLKSGSPKNILSLDDDTFIPEQRIQLKVEDIDERLVSAPNSQALINIDPKPEYFEQSPNSLRSFFRTLGKSVSEARREFNIGLRTSLGQHDTMHIALEEVLKTGFAQFEVGANQRPLENEGNAVIMATTATKYLIPDFRTTVIAHTNFLEEFPDREVNISSYPTGKNEDHAYQKSWTNIDSACCARRIDSYTALILWWHASSLNISRENPHKVVTAHYRSDNELLPVLFEHLYEKAGKHFVYHGGIDTQVSHHRARSGYRPNLIEQAAASLVGNVAALEAIKYIDFSASPPRFRNFDRATFESQIDEAKIMSVYFEFDRLFQVCRDKVNELHARVKQGGDPKQLATNNHKLKKYAHVFNLISQKTDGFRYHSFRNALVDEIFEQLVFYSKVLDAYPVVVEASTKLIQSDQYPAMRARS